jgi:hypothetical protein
MVVEAALDLLGGEPRVAVRQNATHYGVIPVVVRVADEVSVLKAAGVL